MNNDVVTCVLTPDIACPAAATVTSNAVTLTVTPLLTVGITITASSNNTCSGSTVTFTASAVNGGENPVYQWKVNGASSGSGPIYAYIPSNNDQVSCELTTSLGCVVSATAGSNVVAMVVNQVKPVSVSVSESANPVCAGTNVTFTAVGVNAGSAPQYQWMKNGAAVGSNNAYYVCIPSSGDAIYCQLTSSEQCASNNPAASNSVVMTVNPLLPAGISVTPSQNNVCDGTSVTFTAFAVNGGSNPSFNWNVNGNPAGGNSSVMVYVPKNQDNVTCTLVSSANCATGSPVMSAAVVMSVNPQQPVSVSVTASANTVCAGTPVTFTASPVNGGSNPVYQWFVNDVPSGVNSAVFNYVPVNNDIVKCRLTSDAACISGNPAMSAPLTMTVNPSLLVGISVSPSANPVCTGSSVTFTVNPVNQGENPVYQWKVNGSFVGTSSYTYSYIPSNNDQVSCILTSSALCTTNNPAASPVVTMSVHPAIWVGSISADQSVCLNAVPAVLTGTPPTNGSGFTYQWQRSADNNTYTSITGATSLNYLPDPVTAKTFYRCLQDAVGTCGGPMPTNFVTINVIQPVPVSVTISANPAGVIYKGTPVTFSATGINGGANPVYQWKVNGINQGTNNTSFTYSPENNDVITCQLTSGINCVTGSPAISNAITMVVSNDPLLPVTVIISSNPSGPVCPGSQVIYTAIPGNGGATPHYQWKVNGVNAGADQSTFIYHPVNNDQISCVLTSSLVYITGNPATSNVITAVVNPVLPVSVSIAASSNAVCAGTIVTYTATPVNGGANPVYDWRVDGLSLPSNGNEFYWGPGNSDQVQCFLTSSEQCTSGNPAASNIMTMTVNPTVPVNVTISASQNPVCSGTPVTFTAVPDNGGSSPQYNWKVNGMNVGLGLSTFTYAPANNDVVTCVLVSNINCAENNPATSNQVLMTVNPMLTASVTISAGTTTVCAGTSVTLTAIPVNGGGSPAYVWRVNGIVSGSNNSTFTYVPSNGDAITCTLTSSLPCSSGSPVTSNSVSIIVNPVVPVLVTIAVSANPVCTGTSVTYTATGVNGGTSPSFQWKVNGFNAGSGGTVFSGIPGDNDTIRCVMISNAACASGNPALSNKIGMKVNPILPVSVSISASANNVCANTAVTYTALPVNQGTSPVYQWKVNGINTGTNSPTFSYTPVNQDSVSCVLTASGVCLTGNPAKSNVVKMTVYPILTAGLTISASAYTVCAGTSVTFTATPLNGGSSPAYQWKVNNINVGSNSASYTYAPAATDVVKCVMTSSLPCATNNPATATAPAITVNPVLAVSITIVASANPVCAGTAVIYTATPVNGGSPALQWKVNGVNQGTGTLTFSYVPVNNDIITCELTSSLPCATGNPAVSNQVKMTVNPIIISSVTIAESLNNVCVGTSVTFNATAVNPGTSPTYQWKVNGGNVGIASTSNLYTYKPANNDTVTCDLYPSVTCPAAIKVTSNKIGMIMVPSPVASVSIATPITTFCNGTSVTVTATPVNGGTTPVYQWKINNVNAGTNSPTFTYTFANNNVVTCVMTSSLSCVAGSPDTSNQIVFTVNPVLPVSVSIAANPTGTVCQGNSVTFTATPVNGGLTPAYQWKVNTTSVAGATNATYTYVPVNGDVVSCTLNSSALCPSGNPASSNTITMSVSTSQPVNVAVWTPNYAVMPSTQITLYAVPTNGGNTPTYSWLKNDVAVGTNSSTYVCTPVNNDNIKCVVTSSLGGCLSTNPATSNVVNMVVYSTGAACAGVPTVSYGGRTYNTVQIGTQCWLRENLNIGTKLTSTSTTPVSQTNNSIIEKYCYNNDTNYCNVYGGLYQWAEMVQYYLGVTNTTYWTSPYPTLVQGICPSGWHIPTKIESDTLVKKLGSTTAGGKMKETLYTHWQSPNTGADNASGFTALPAGYGYNGAYGNIKQYANIWTITNGATNTDIYYFGAVYNFKDPASQQSFKTTGYSVRCLKN